MRLEYSTRDLIVRYCAGTRYSELECFSIDHPAHSHKVSHGKKSLSRRIGFRLAETPRCLQPSHLISNPPQSPEKPGRVKIFEGKKPKQKTVRDPLHSDRANRVGRPSDFEITQSSKQRPSDSRVPSCKYRAFHACMQPPLPYGNFPLGIIGAHAQNEVCKLEPNRL